MALQLKTQTYRQRFFLVSAGVVIVSGILTVIVWISIVWIWNRTNDSTKPVSLANADALIHELSPFIADNWDKPESWQSEVLTRKRDKSLDRVSVGVLSLDGKVMYAESDLYDRFRKVDSQRLANLDIIRLLAENGRIDGKNWVYAVAPVRRKSGAYLGVMTVDIKNYDTTSAPMPVWVTLIVPMVITVIVSLAGSEYLGRRLRRSLEGLSAGIAAMSQGDYHKRLEVRGSDEVSRVATVFNLMADRLEEARRQEKALDALKRDLVANVSHDLRTPLMSIRGYLEALDDGLAKDPETAAKYLSIINHKTRMLAHLVEDLLQYSRLESGNLPLRKSLQDCADWLRESLALAEPEVERAGLVLEADIPEVGDTVYIDGRKMAQVISNLIENAVRHSPRFSTITVEYKPGSREVGIAIIDAGEGFAIDDLPYIFDRFYRGRNAADGLGTGLGLAIAAQLVQAHGGTISATNRLEGGAEVRFTIPIVDRTAHLSLSNMR